MVKYCNFFAVNVRAKKNVTLCNFFCAVNARTIYTQLPQKKNGMTIFLVAIIYDKKDYMYYNVNITYVPPPPPPQSQYLGFDED